MLPDILSRILAKKREVLADAKARLPEAELVRRCADLPPTRGFGAALARPGLHVIAEAKKASPSKGVIAEDFDVEAIVRNYERLGASACSILTEEAFFLGSLDVLRKARKATSLPLLRKDFIFDGYQLLEAREAGADAVLLIAAMLEDEPLRALYLQAETLGLDVLGEAHTAEEVERLAKAGVRIIGVNARDLRTFKTDLAIVRALIEKVPEACIAVAESAIFSKADMLATGARRFLIGEALMRKPELLRELLA